MSAWEVFFQQTAAREYTHALDRYRKAPPQVFDRFLKAVADAIAKIEDNPHQWPIYRGVFRWVRLRKFPYIVFYYVFSPERVKIMAFAHTHRRPGYWLRRKQ